MTTRYVSETYEGLCNIFFQWILDNCQNINTLKSTIDKSMLSDFSITDKARRSGVSDAVRRGKHQYGAKPETAGGGVTINIDTNSTISAVPFETVKSQFEAFLVDRNLNSKITNKITLSTNGILNFWNNVAAFCNTHLVFVSSPLSLNTVLIYDPDNTRYDEVNIINAKKTIHTLNEGENKIPLDTRVANKQSIIKITLNGIELQSTDYAIDSPYDVITLVTPVNEVTRAVIDYYPIDEVITASHVDDMLLQLEASINKSSKVKSITYSFMNFSSSSCSSSCSSSSCSSSSSSFISYMKLGS